MKVLSFKPLAVLLAIALTTSGVDLFADQCCHTHKGHGCKSKTKPLKHEIEMLELELALDGVAIYGAAVEESLVSIFTTLGFSANPDPTSNPQLAGAIDENYRVILANIGLSLEGLRELGVPQTILAALEENAIDYVDTSIAYALAVNINNKLGGGGGDESALAAQLQSIAQAQAELIASLTGDQNIGAVLSQFTTLMEQLTLAWAGFLAEPNPWDAVLGNLQSQAEAAVKIQEAITLLIEEQRERILNLPIFR